MFPLESFRIGRTGSYAQLPDQRFVIIDNDKFVFFVVNKEKEENTHGDTYYQVVKKYWNKLLSLSNYFILESNKSELGYYGTIAFEVRYNELYGMEFTNSLLQDSCRIVTECQSLRKKCFKNVVDMLKYYEVEYTNKDSTSVEDKK